MTVERPTIAEKVDTWNDTDILIDFLRVMLKRTRIHVCARAPMIEPLIIVAIAMGMPGSFIDDL